MTISDRAGADAIREAEKAYALARSRKEEIREMAKRYLQRREYASLPWWRRRLTRVQDMPVDAKMLRVVTMTWAVGDPDWANSMADARWHYDRAAAYGVNHSGRFRNE